MRPGRILLRIGLLVAASAVVTSANGQEPSTTSAAGSTSTAPAASPTPGTSSTPANPEVSELNVPDYVVGIQKTYSSVSSLADSARTKKDAIKLNCVNDRKIQIEAYSRLFKQANDAYQLAKSQGNREEARHQLARMTIIYQKITVLGTEAENCVGNEASYTGATAIEIDIDPSIPDEDPTLPQLPLPDVTRPPEASPFT